jgi:hypothetical protein
MKVIATVNPHGDILAISAAPEGTPRLTAVLLPDQLEVEITDHDIQDDDSDEVVHRKLNQIRRTKGRMS